MFLWQFQSNFKKIIGINCLEDIWGETNLRTDIMNPKSHGNIKEREIP
tara:strand:- start:77 stop:220 length:144 start_codon:yes stop_codon:yes gene_type:complete